LRVCTFHTDSVYKAHALSLRESVSHHGFSIDIHEMPDLGSWGANVAQKPEVILRTLTAHPLESILYIDADAFMVEKPALTWDESKDFAAYFERRPQGKMAPCGGTLWIRNTPVMKNLILSWKAAATLETHKADDWVHLSGLLSGIPKSKIERLPPSWLWHEATMRQRFPGVNPVISHGCVGAHDYLEY
jgi:hypothetical protein